MAKVGMRDMKYVDSTPKLSVGDSAFESWFQAHPKACTGDKQLARDAYAAGMGDPLVTYVTVPSIEDVWKALIKCERVAIDNGTQEAHKAIGEAFKELRVALQSIAGKETT